MTRLITASELERYSETELRLLRHRIWQELIRSESGSLARALALASLENIERALNRRLWTGPKL